MKKSIKISGISILAVATLLVSYNTFYKNESKSIKSKGEVAVNDLSFEKGYTQILTDTYGLDYSEKVERNEYLLETSNNISKKFMNSEGKMEYPNYYGGTYIDDNENLVIQIVKGNVPSKKSKSYGQYNTIMDIANGSKVEYVDNSFNQLNQISDKISEYFSSQNANYDNLAEHYIDVINNKIIVVLVKNSLEQQELFRKEIVDSDLIEFNEGEKVSFAYDWKVGDFMYGSACTYGYRARLNGKTGFVTAGHCGLKVGEGQDFEGMGVLKKRVFDGSVDALFVEGSSSQTFLNTLTYPVYPAYELDTLDYVSPTVNLAIGKSGGKTKGTSGKITKVNVGLNAKYTDVDGVEKTKYLSKMVGTNVKGAKGDSGSAMFSLTRKGRVVGILSSVDDSGNSYYTDQYQIKQRIPLTRY